MLPSTLSSIEQYYTIPFLDDCINSIRECNLKFYARDMLDELGYRHLDQLKPPLQRAMDICRTLDIPVRENFKRIYRAEGPFIYIDWKLSPLAYYLIIINGDAMNPSVARAQVNLLMKKTKGL